MRISQTFITGSILIGAGAYNTYKDYVAAPPEQKARTLTRNVTALGAAAVAVVSADRFMSSKFSSEVLQNFAHKVSNAIVQNKFVKNIWGKLKTKKELQPVKLEALSDMVANCTKDVTLSAAAALSGIGAGLLVDRILFLSKKADKQEQAAMVKQENLQNQNQLILPKKVHNILENPMVTKVANDRTRDLIINTTKVFEAAGFITNPFEMPSVIMSGLDMAKEKNLQKIVEQTSSGIVAEALIPTFFISLTNSLTKNKSAWVKIPAIAASFYLGDFVGEKVGTMLTHEIRDEIFDIDEDEQNQTSLTASENEINIASETSPKNDEDEEQEDD